MGCDDRGRDYEAEARQDKIHDQFRAAMRKVDNLPLLRMKVRDLHNLVRLWNPGEYHTTSEDDVKVLNEILRDCR